MTRCTTSDVGCGGDCKREVLKLKGKGANPRLNLISGSFLLQNTKKKYGVAGLWNAVPEIPGKEPPLSTGEESHDESRGQQGEAR
eukprot:scaffold11326_cov109-Skeletonema_dohrnii-CCMP3373.AAC.1